MNLGDFTVVGLSETSITLQQVQPMQGENPLPPLARAGGFQQTIPATIEQTRNLFISQVLTMTLTSKVVNA